jgi:hypothetical protein
MKTLTKTSFLGFLPLILLAGSFAPASARLGDQFSALRKDKFFIFFRFDTAVRVIDGKIVTRPWASTLKRKIEARITLSPDSNVIGIQVLFDSNFVDSNWRMSRNLGKIFLREETPLRDSVTIDTFANEVEFVKRHNLVYLGDEPKLPEIPTEPYQVFLHKRDSYTMQLFNSRLELTHVRKDGRMWLSMNLQTEGSTEPKK